PGVSERHALLMLSGDKASVEDMGSDAGTLVNAVPVAKRTPVTRPPSAYTASGT
ncbi:MAG: FHA domain-containing protein, partial [Kiritimatiellae bacterium]|nr:FHA domain-containing protein [Kiritimatiellia bacterium]